MRTSLHGNSEYKAGQILKRRIAAFCAGIMAAICVLVAQAVIKGRDAAFDRTRGEAANLSAGFEEGVQESSMASRAHRSFSKITLKKKGQKEKLSTLQAGRAKFQNF